MNTLPDGLYDLLLDAHLRELALQLRDAGQAQVEPLTGAARRRRLAEVLARLLPELLDEAMDAEDDAAREQRELALINGLLTHLRRGDAAADQWTAPVLALRAIHRGQPRPTQPPTGLLAPWLFTAGRADPSLFAELRAELGSADRVDIVVSFITWSGLRKLLDVLESVTAIGANGEPRTRLRVITTTYTGATEARAVEALAALPGVELRVSLDGRRSRLHAKAWLFHRATGFGTAFVGSANLSAAALLGGVEWTVKFTQAGQADLFAAAEAHFETLWNDPEFQRFDPQDDQHRLELRRALQQAKGANFEPIATPTWFDLQPKSYQQAMLDRLAAERRHGRTRNLVVAATGTGKTVVAAFDYKRLCEQQLGRGLRLADGKDSCLVLDFVGRLQNDFRFDLLYRAITGLNRQQLIEAVEQGFTTLPPGCHIQFDRVARDRVLTGLRQISNQNWRRLTAELRYYATTRRGAPLALADFVRDQCLDLEDLYDGKPGWTALCRAAGLEQAAPDPDETYLGKHLGALLHVDDPEHLRILRRVAEDPAALLAQCAQLAPAERRRIQMLAYQIFSDRSALMDVPAFLTRMAANPAICRELAQLATCLDEHADLDPQPLPGAPTDWPLTLHAAYEIREILTAVGWLTPERRAPFQAGVLALPEHKTELLFVTLDKRDGFNERIAYHDYAISPELFHWQSQNSAGPDTPAGRRYCESPGNGWQFQLFVREARGQAYRALGPVRLERWEGDRPLSITWRLERGLPVGLFKRYSVLRS